MLACATLGLQRGHFSRTKQHWQEVDNERLTIHNIHRDRAMLNDLAGSKTSATAQVQDGHASAVTERGFLQLMLQYLTRYQKNKL